MSYRPRWENGGWNVICDSCGRLFKSSELQLRWDGLMVCRGDWEPRQPQDFVHGVADKQAPPFARPESSNLFIIPAGFFTTPISVSTSNLSSTIIRTSKHEINGQVLNTFTLG